MSPWGGPYYIVEARGYIWDVETLDWIKSEGGGSGPGTEVTVTNFPAVQVVSGPMTDAEFEAHLPLPVEATIDTTGLATSAALTPATGVMNLSAIWMPQGQIVTGITFVTIGGPTTSTHLWVALYRSDLGTASPLLAQSTDDVTSTDAPANTAFRRALTAPQTLPYTGVYYVGWMQTSSGQNTLMCAVSQSVNGNGNITGMTPVLAFTHATTGLTTTAPATLGATTAVIASRLFAFLD